MLNMFSHILTKYDLSLFFLGGRSLTCQLSLPIAAISTDRFRTQLAENGLTTDQILIELNALKQAVQTNQPNLSDDSHRDRLAPGKHYSCVLDEVRHLISLFGDAFLQCAGVSPYRSVALPS